MDVGRRRRLTPHPRIYFLPATVRGRFTGRERKVDRNFVAGVLAIMSVVALAGCGNKPEPKVAGGAAAVEQQVDALAPRYESSLAAGIDFKRPGYPTFLAEVSGMSGHEGWGRWTDASAGGAAKFRFTRPLPPKFTVELTANAFGPNLGKPVKVRIGGIEREFVVKDSQASELYVLTFEGVNGADTIEIVPPQPTSPKQLDPQSGDSRLLGVSLVSLQIKT